MRHGTAYFPSHSSAINDYYDYCGHDYNRTIEYVGILLNEQSIFIGPPPLKKGEKAIIIDNRYHVEEVSSRKEYLPFKCEECGTSYREPKHICGYCNKPFKKSSPKKQTAVSPIKVALNVLNRVGERRDIQRYCVLIQKGGEWKVLESGEDFMKCEKLYSETECTARLYKCFWGKVTEISGRYVDEAEHVARNGH